MLRRFNRCSFDSLVGVATLMCKEFLQKYRINENARFSNNNYVSIDNTK